MAAAGGALRALPEGPRAAALGLLAERMADAHPLVATHALEARPCPPQPQVSEGLEARPASRMLPQLS